MPMHDWTKVDSGIYHDFHHEWISAIKHSLNQALPDDYYALAEQYAGTFGPDVVALQSRHGNGASSGGTALATRPKPKTSYSAESAGQFYRRNQKNVVIRHVSGDEVVAMIELVSPGNKSSQYHLNAFVEKACELIQRQIHLLIVDPFPASKRDPQGIHGAIWESLVDESFVLPANRPLTLVSYECFNDTRAYIEPFAVGEPLPDMPLYLAPEAYIDVPLEATYQAAWANVPQRWQREIAATPATPR